MGINKTWFGLGLFIALLAAALLLLGVISSGVAAAIGMLGIGLIATSGRSPASRPVPRQQEQVIYAPDNQLRAVLHPRGDGNYHVEIQQIVHDYAPDVGSHDRWERVSSSIHASLAEALEAAAQRVGAGTVDFFGKGS